MATYVSVTTSNGAVVADEEALQSVLDEWGVIPYHRGLTVEIDNGVFRVYGEGDFEPYPLDGERLAPHRRHEQVDVIGFLEAIVDHLDEEFVIQTIGREKQRYPFNAVQRIADPVSGEVTSQGFYGQRADWLEEVRE
jgi:hypothetical protein